MSSRTPVPTWFFVLAVVRRRKRFLLVQERKHGQLWYLPAGRVEPGEDFVAALRRETFEEAGIPIQVDGLLRVETDHAGAGLRMRLVFAAQPADDTPPKSQPDEESLRAGWFTLDEMRFLPLRGPEVLDFCAGLAAGLPVAPLSLLGREGAPMLLATH